MLALVVVVRCVCDKGQESACLCKNAICILIVVQQDRDFGIVSWVLAEEPAELPLHGLHVRGKLLLLSTLAAGCCEKRVSNVIITPPPSCSEKWWKDDAEPQAKGLNRSP